MIDVNVRVTLLDEKVAADPNVKAWLSAIEQALEPILKREANRMWQELGTRGYYVLDTGELIDEVLK